VVEAPHRPLRPVTVTWPAGRPIIRAHPSEFGATELDGRPGADGRFSPLRFDSRVVPVLYGAGDDETAAAETIFHTVPAREGITREIRPRQVALAPYVSWVWSTIESRRDLALVSLRGDGLARLQTTRLKLILGGRKDWPRTRRWAEALLVDAPHADGLWWTSRQSKRSDALMLFGRHRGRSGGVGRGELKVVVPPLPFLAPEGFERLCGVATRLDVTLLLD
jgi:hypothetical protein